MTGPVLLRKNKGKESYTQQFGEVVLEEKKRDHCIQNADQT
jgi:hypothetical protein